MFAIGKFIGPAVGVIGTALTIFPVTAPVGAGIVAVSPLVTAATKDWTIGHSSNGGSAAVNNIPVYPNRENPQYTAWAQKYHAAWQDAEFNARFTGKPNTFQPAPPRRYIDSMGQLTNNPTSSTPPASSVPPSSGSSGVTVLGTTVSYPVLGVVAGLAAIGYMWYKKII